MSARSIHILAFTFFLFVLSGCARQTYYVNAFNGNNTTYHAMPLKTDSVKSRYYAGTSLFIGTANADNSDSYFGWEGNIYNARQFGIFQAYAGIDATLGNFKVAGMDSSFYTTTISYNEINSRAGSKFFGGIGLQAGINIVLPISKGEWRCIGTELTSHREFGSFADFREALPEGSATLLIKNKSFTTAGLYSEVLQRTNGKTYGLKLAYGGVLEKNYRGTKVRDEDFENLLRFRYTTVTLHYSAGKWTGFLQGNSSTKSKSSKFGVLYQL